MLDNLSRSHDDPLDQRIVAALQTPPSIHIPHSFAASIATQAHARFGPLPQPRPAPRFGTLAIRIGLAALLLAMLLLARHPGFSPTLSFALQTTLCFEFIALSLYLGLTPLSILPILWREGERCAPKPKPTWPEP